MYVEDRFHSHEELVNISYKAHPVLSMRTFEEMASNIYLTKEIIRWQKFGSMFFKNTFSITYENS
jgi:hypothetical protein